jgi:hypothetical protein
LAGWGANDDLTLLATERMDGCLRVNTSNGGKVMLRDDYGRAEYYKAVHRRHAYSQDLYDMPSKIRVQLAAQFNNV